MKKERTPKQKGVKVPPTPEQREKAKKKLIRLILVFVITLVLFSVYEALCNLGMLFIFWVYFAVLAVFLAVYTFANCPRPFTELTEEDLSDRMTAQQKKEFLEHRLLVRKKTSWMMLVILPLIIVFLFDMMVLFWGDTVTAFLKDLGIGLW